MTTNRERDTDDLIAQALYSIGHAAKLVDEVAKLMPRVPRPELLGVKPHDTYPHKRTLSRQVTANSQAIDKLAKILEGATLEDDRLEEFTHWITMLEGRIMNRHMAALDAVRLLEEKLLPRIEALEEKLQD